MLCAACSSHAPEGSRFCPACGVPLADATLATPAFFEAETMAPGVSTATRWRPGMASLPIEPGTVLGGRYRLTAPVGRGGMGVVFAADDLRLGTRVALKFLDDAFGADRRRLSQFLNEVNLARQITHANVCRVFDLEDVDGHVFLSMELVDGEDLGAAIRRRGAFPEPEVIELTRQLCNGLAVVHGRGILHRDLKPANVMLTAGGEARLMDFGIAVADDRTRDGAGSTDGTPVYMAPEQLRGGEATVRTDIYAVGLVMFEMLAGARLFRSTSIDGLREAQLTAQTTAERLLPPSVSPALRAVVRQCLAVDPEQRPASVGALAALLQVTLLDEVVRGRRILQVATQSTFVPLGILAVALLVSSTTAGRVAAIAILAVLAGAAFYELRHPLGWIVRYKGHDIRFHNHPVWGERLYIDGRLMDRGRFGFAVTMRGTIESGTGAGERITAEARAEFLRLHCRIVAESFAAAGAGRLSGVRSA